MERGIDTMAPDSARAVMRDLRDAGFEAYAVGGCVRDALLGREPHDWDLTTNATPEQMKLFLTRLGFRSKMVITGDDTQLDLPRGISGLKGIQDILEGVDDIAFCRFDEVDVVRHSLVSAIVAAYARAEAKG